MPDKAGSVIFYQEDYDVTDRRCYQRNQILLSFVAKKELSDDGKEVNVKVPFGLDAPFHHLFERGTCPVFMAVGKVRNENRLSAASEGSPHLEARKILRVN